MSELIATVGGRVVDAGLAAGLISGLALLAMLATRQPSRRRSIARAGVLGCLLALPLVTIRPIGPIDIVAPLRLAIGPSSEWIGGRLGLDATVPRWLGSSRQLVQPVGVCLIVAYGLGVGVGLARLMLGWLGSVWIVRQSSESDPEVDALYRSIPFDSGRARPRLRVSSRTRRPVLLGIIRPTILVPSALVEPGAREDFRLAMRHELAHAEASDPPFAMASELAGVFWFFVPPLWWVKRQLRLDAEFLADRQAALAYGASRRYASGLVEVAASPATLSGAVAARGVPSGAGSALFQRVMMLVRCPFPIERRPPQWWSGLLVATSALVVPTLTGLTLRSVSTVEPARAEPSPGQVTIARWILDDAITTTTPNVLPVRVPGRFTLEFEVYARSAELAEIRVLGQPLTAPLPVPNSLLDDALRWHRVRIVRGEARLTFVVNSGRPIAIESPSVEEWISIRAVPGRATTFRAIRIQGES